MDVPNFDEVTHLVDRAKQAWPEVAALLKDHPTMVKAIGDSLWTHAEQFYR
jgi:hypothetical protein